MTDPLPQTLKVEFSLSECDLEFFQKRLDQACEKFEGADESRILAGVSDMMDKAYKSNPPEFVRSRIAKLGPLLAMLEDPDWNLEHEDRDRVISALAYFSDPEDLIPDSTPGIGYVDDAIMIDLVLAGLAPELEAYQDFVAHRVALKADVPDAKVSLEDARTEMQSRMRRRRGRAKAGGLWAHSTNFARYGYRL